MKTKKLIFATVMVMTMSLTMLQISAQCTAPRMQIPNDVRKMRTDKFTNDGMLKKLKDNCGNYHPMTAGTIDVKAFFDFLKAALTATGATATGLKVYFAAENRAGATQNRLFLIYGFTKTATVGTITSDRWDDGTYYRYNTSTDAFEPMDAGLAKTCHQHFYKFLNMDPDETHSLWYRKTELVEWMTKIECQQTQIPAPDIKEIQLEWAVYEKNIKDPIDGTALNKPTVNRLTLLFTIPNAAEMALRRDGNYDTAVPCPPGNNCVGDGLDG